MNRLTVMTPNGAALKMNDTYPDETAAREDLMEKFYAAVDRLAAYEDTEIEPEKIEKLIEAVSMAGLQLYANKTENKAVIDYFNQLVGDEPNDPLTLEELREMDGEPVWCVSRGGESRWGIVHVYGDCSYEFECYTTEYGRIVGGSYGMDGMDGNDGWLAYRRKKEEEMK